MLDFGVQRRVLAGRGGVGPDVRRIRSARTPAPAPVPGRVPSASARSIPGPARQRGDRQLAPGMLTPACSRDAATTKTAGKPAEGRPAGLLGGVRLDLRGCGPAVCGDHLAGSPRHPPSGAVIRAEEALTDAFFERRWCRDGIQWIPILGRGADRHRQCPALPAEPPLAVPPRLPSLLTCAGPGGGAAIRSVRAGTTFCPARRLHG